MAQCNLLLNTGDAVLLNTGDNVLLNDDTCTAGGGLQLSGTHATQAFYGSRPEQLIDIEFTFRLISCLITITGLKICVKSVLERVIKSNVKVKSLLIKQEKITAKIKSSILMHRERTDSKIYSAILRKESVKAGLFSNVSKSKKKQMKERLLKKLQELWDNDE